MSDKRVLITGGSHGIGEQIAYEFSKRGYLVAITYSGDKESAERVASRCREFGAPRTYCFVADLREHSSVEILVKNIQNDLGSLDVLVNNAGITIAKSLREQTEEEIAAQLAVNLTAVIRLTRLLLPITKDTIVNIGSALSFRPKRNLSVYTATKAGLRAFTLSLAREEHKLRIFAVHPSLTATNPERSAGMSPAFVAKLIGKIVSGEYAFHSGQEILVRDYRWGERGRSLIRFIERGKWLFNKIIGIFHE